MLLKFYRCILRTHRCHDDDDNAISQPKYFHTGLTLSSYQTPHSMASRAETHNVFGRKHSAFAQSQRTQCQDSSKTLTIIVSFVNIVKLDCESDHSSGMSFVSRERNSYQKSMASVFGRNKTESTSYCSSCKETGEQRLQCSCLFI
jgi:hypothetical protein